MIDLDTWERLAAEAMERAEKATKGPWKTWAMSVMADVDGTSNVDTAIPVAHTCCRDERGQLRTFDANFIAAARSDVPDLASALCEAVAEIQRLRAILSDPTVAAFVRARFPEPVQDVPLRGSDAKAQGTIERREGPHCVRAGVNTFLTPGGVEPEEWRTK